MTDSQQTSLIEQLMRDGESNTKESRWVLTDEHPEYGMVVMMGCLSGEPYRWFKDKHGAIAMIPLDSLPEFIT